jgi:tetratricopeptide (TPR) repeat protein
MPPQLIGWTTVSIVSNVIHAARPDLTNGLSIADYLRVCTQNCLFAGLESDDRGWLRGAGIAGLYALDFAARRHADLAAAELNPDADVTGLAFVAALRGHLDGQLGAAGQRAAAPDRIVAADLERMLTEIARTTSADSFRELSAETRVEAEWRTLMQLEARVGLRAPRLFWRAFQGGGKAGWFDVIAMFVLEALQAHAPLRAIFFPAAGIDDDRAIALIGARQSAYEKQHPELKAVMHDMRARRTWSESDRGASGSRRSQNVEHSVARRAEAALIAQKAQAARDNGDLETAAIDFAESVRLNPDMMSVWCEMGQVYSMRGDHARAAEAFSAAGAVAERLGDDQSMAYVAAIAGEAKIAQGDIEGGRACLEAAVRVWRRPIESGQKTIQNQKDILLVLARLGDLRLGQGELSVALSLYEEGLAITERLTAHSSEGASETQLNFE